MATSSFLRQFVGPIVTLLAVQSNGPERLRLCLGDMGWHLFNLEPYALHFAFGAKCAPCGRIGLVKLAALVELLEAVDQKLGV